MNAIPMMKDRSLPMMLRVPAGDGIAWARENAAEIQAIAEKAGVVLLRGFDLSSPAAFRAVCQAIEPDLRPYTGGDSPRTGVTDQVYTSTEYDADLEVFLHNELSYAGWSPRIVFFGCLIPSAEGGETHIADGRQVYQAIPSDIRDRFETRGIVYLQHLWDADGAPGIGKSWQETFETDSRDAVEAYLRQSGMDWTWTEYGIRTRAPHDAIVTHPKTGEKCWWNQADQWHRDLGGVKTSFGGSDDPRFDAATAGEESLGNHVIYGDGTEIAADDLRTVRSVTQSLEVAFPWEAGDVMVVDNVLAMHGRKPFKGDRRILVAMA